MGNYKISALANYYIIYYPPDKSGGNSKKNISKSIFLFSVKTF